MKARDAAAASAPRRSRGRRASSCPTTRAEDLDDAAARQAADAEREVERERPRRDCADRHLRLVAHPHDRALAELALDLAERDARACSRFNRSSS